MKDHGQRRRWRGRWTRRAAVAWLGTGAAAAALLAACGGGSGSASAPTSSSVASAPATSGGSGCGTGAASGSTTLSPTVAGHARSVIVHIPSGYGGSVKVPLVLNMHGSGSTASEQQILTGMDATADTDGFIVAYPQALIPDSSGFDWNVPGQPLVGNRAVPKNAANDVAFLSDLVGVLSQRYCIDPARVFATGISGGGRMASQLACDASATFAAVAPVAGLRYPAPCPATRPVPVVAFHGTADPIDPYNGHGQAYWTYSVPDAAAGWARQNQCPPASTSQLQGYTLTSYQGCAGGSSVQLYSITGEGHEWPGGPPLPNSITKVLGRQSNAVNANMTMWAFFAAHPKP